MGTPRKKKTLPATPPMPEDGMRIAFAFETRGNAAQGWAEVLRALAKVLPWVALIVALIVIGVIVWRL